MSLLSVARQSARTLLLASTVTLALLPSTPAHAQTSYYFPDTAADDLDPAIPSPEQFLGYPIGSRYTRHDRLVEYMRELARLSDRVTVKEIGRTYEDRPLITLFVTSPRNHARLEAIRREHAVLADPNGAAVDPRQVPVVVGLYYSVHGNETSSGEAALLTAYYLAAARSERVRHWLDDAVILIDPAQNPDGRDRAANWHNSWRSNPPSADPLDREHVEGFPMGRTNHYYTDLNRDWLAITQAETRTKIDLFHQWTPNVQIDFHEMGSGSTYYFEPSPPEMESPLLPKASYAFNRTMARYYARALDRLGSLYYSGENYDNFSPVYGSTYPDFHGGVGATFEQASSRGLVQDTANGPLEFRFTIRNHVATGLGTIEGAVAEHAGLFQLQRQFFQSAVQQGAKARHAAFVFGDPADPGLTRQMLDLLLQHRIEVHPLTAPVTIDGQHFDPGSAYVVPSRQPQFRLVHSIFEETPPATKTVYGSTSYAIAHAYGLRVGRAERLPKIGAEVTALPATAGGVRGAAGAYAYAIDWRDLNAPRVLSALLQQGIRVRVAQSGFTAAAQDGSTPFGIGTLIVPAAGQSLQPDALHAAVDAAARDAGVPAYALPSGDSVEGVDLGSDAIKAIEKPVIALVVGEGVNASEIGSTWFALSERLHYPVTKLDIAQIAQAPLDRYTSIVLAGGSYSSWSDATVSRVKTWIEAGGSLIAFGTAARWAVSKGLIGSEAKDAQAKAGTDDSAGTVRRDFADRRDVEAQGRTSGNLVSADVDVTHPLAFGVPRRAFFVQKDSEVVLAPIADPFSTVVAVDRQPLVNGYMSDRLHKRLAGSVWAQVARAGKGNVVLFADDPAHRKYWLGTERLLINGLFFSKELTPTGR
ncbi:M14 family zinc carboxypeptidase [uncultured Sphingomonas sp.]|uniref:M14 family zinc carboxypeptidase n=1 Tax=uncultured Sphingomonas sp. TaxID=158754 RepID=UPI0025D95050|nr:M14 family zinc carboxypeptidase [uncultured Sphingomonas sp.]